MEMQRAGPSRRAVLGGVVGGLALAAVGPRMAFASGILAGGIRTLAFGGGALLAAAGGLWRSRDGGATWTELPAPGSEITALAAHPDRPGRILAGLTLGGVMVSGDGGDSWANAGSGLPEAPVMALAIATHAPDTVYAAVAGDGLWASKDAGKSWEFAMDRPYEDGAERDLLTLASVNLATGMGGFWIYAGTESGLTRLPDCFCRWQDVQPANAMDALAAGETPPAATPLPAREAVRSLAVAPDRPAVIHAALSSGIWTSTDAGVTWAKAHAAGTHGLAVDPGDPLHIVAATSGGILTSRDGGLTWTAPGARDGERT